MTIRVKPESALDLPTIVPNGDGILVSKGKKVAVPKDLSWHVTGRDWFIHDPQELNLVSHLDNAAYMISQTGPPFFQFYLEHRDDPFALPPKLYGTVPAQADRIINTFDARPQNTGVLLEGVKGSGKTLLARLVCSKLIKRGTPVLMLTKPFAGDNFSKFLSSIKQPKVVLADEFEKVYPGSSWTTREDDGDDEKKKETGNQKYLLSLLDGIYPSKTLWLFTANDKFKIDSHMINRPGRVFYSLTFAGLDTNFVREFASDTLTNLKHVENLVKMVGHFKDFTFDALNSLVEEMNRYDEPPAEALKWLNIRSDKDKGRYKIKVSPLRPARGFKPRPHPSYTSMLFSDVTSEQMMIVILGMDNKDKDKHAHINIDPDIHLTKSMPEKGLYVYHLDDENLEVTLQEIFESGPNRLDVGYRRIAFD